MRKIHHHNPNNFSANYTVWPLGWTARWSGADGRIIQCPRCGRRGAYLPRRQSFARSWHKWIEARIIHRYDAQTLDDLCLLLGTEQIALADSRANAPPAP